MNYMVKIEKGTMKSYLILSLCLLSTIALNAKNCCPNVNNNGNDNTEIDMEAYQHGRDDEKNSYPYYSYVRTKKRYSYNCGRKDERDELQSEGNQRLLKVSPYICRFYTKQVDTSDLTSHGPMYNNPNYIQALR